MTTKKTVSTHRQTHPATMGQPSAYHRLDALLHTMRCIAQYEDALCELSHEAKQAGNLSPEIIDELREIVEKIPSYDYMMDLNALKAVLIEARPTAKSSQRKSAKSVQIRKGSTVAKKKPGRKSSR